MTILLYDGQRSPNARKVRLLAAELEIPLERVTLDFTKGELRSASYLSKNPNAKIPTIEEDSFVLWESAAILRWLAAKNPERGLVPTDPRQLALLDQWMFWYAANIDPPFLLLVFELLVKKFLGQGEPDASVVGVAQRGLKRFLPILDAQLEGKEYVLGKLTIADFQMAPWLDLAPMLGVDLAAYANINAWLERLRARPYWATA
jgi:glutathione S-transferase